MNNSRCANKADVDISTQTVLFFTSGKILCFLPEELTHLYPLDNGAYQLPIFDDQKNVSGPLIDKSVYELSLSGGLDQTIAIKLVKGDTPIFSGYEMDGEEVRRFFGTEKSVSIWGGLIEEILHLQGGLQMLMTDPSLKDLYQKLQRVENTKSLFKLRNVLKNAFSEDERNRLNSPLLDQLHDMMKNVSVNDVKKFLMYAIDQKYFSLTDFLLKRGADATILDNFPIRRAVQHNSAAIVQLLLDHGADVHVEYDEALRRASKNGYVEIVQLLLDHGADVHAEDDDALRSACVSGSEETVRLLLSHGALVNAYYGSALVQASSIGHLNIVTLLLEHGADVNARGNGALHAASANGHIEVVKLLIKAGATADSDALDKASEHGHIELVQLLLDHGATSDNALTVASQKGNINIIDLLLQQKMGNINDALIVASEYGKLDTVKLLLDHGADVHARNDAAARAASDYDWSEVVDLLIEHGVDPSISGRHFAYDI